MPHCSIDNTEDEKTSRYIERKDLENFLKEKHPKVTVEDFDIVVSFSFSLAHFLSREAY